MRGSRKFCQRGTNSDNVIFLFLDEGRLDGGGMADPNTAISGPSSARQQNAIEMAQH